MGSASNASTTSSVTSTLPTSRCEKPMTRRVASSRARSASEMRALFYTTPKATTVAKVR